MNEHGYQCLKCTAYKTVINYKGFEKCDDKPSTATVCYQSVSLMVNFSNQRILITVYPLQVLKVMLFLL